MASDFKRVRYIRPRYSQKSYDMLMKMLQDSMSLEVSDVAQFRYHVLTHYYKYGLRPTRDAFKIKKSSLYNWRNAYEKSGRKVSSLIPHGTRPLTVRKMETDYRLVKLIKELRYEHGNIGKHMLKPFVDAYAKELGIDSIGLTTIGKVIKREGLPLRRKSIHKKRKTSSKSYGQESHQKYTLLDLLRWIPLSCTSTMRSICL